MTNLEKLLKKLTKTRNAHDSAMDDVHSEVARLCGCDVEDLVHSDFPGDAFSVGLSEEAWEDKTLCNKDGNVLAPVDLLVGVLNETGKLTLDDVVQHSTV